MNPQDPSLSRAWAERLRLLLAPDPRSLALLRVGLALYLLQAALCVLPDAVALWSDRGLLPRALAYSFDDGSRVSLHLANGSALFAWMLAALQVLAAVMLLLGWHTRTATALAWVLAVSALARAPMLSGYAEAASAALLFWGLFLPWDARASVDAARAAANLDARPPPPALDFAGSGLVLHLLLIVLLLALDPAWPAALGAPGLARVATPMLALVVVLTVLPLLRPWSRRLAALLLAVLALSAMLLLDAAAGWVALCAAAVLIDGGLWDRLARPRQAGELRLVHAPGDAAAQRTAAVLREVLALPACQVLPASDSPRAGRLLQGGRRLVLLDRDDSAHFDAEAVAVLLQRSPLLRPLRALLPASLGARTFQRLMRGSAPVSARIPAPAGPVAQVLAGLALLLLLAAAIGGGAPAPLKTFALDLSLHPRAVPVEAGWLVVPGETRDEREVDVLAAGATAPDYSRAQPGPIQPARWQRLVQSMLRQPALQASTAAYLCAQANAGVSSEAPERLQRLRLVWIRPGERAEQQVLSRHDCP